MSTISRISSFAPKFETAGSAAVKKEPQTCPPNCPECSQVSFKGDEFYMQPEKTRKKKNGKALLATAGLIAVSAASVIGLGKLHNSPKIANLKDGWVKNCLESVTRNCDNACKFVKEKAVAAWDWVKNIGKKGN